MRSTVYIPYIIFGYLSLFTMGLLDNARGPYFSDILNGLNLSDTQGAFLFVTTSLVSFFMGQAAPTLIKSMNLIWLARVGHLVMAAGFFSIAWASNLSTLILAAAFFGFGFGTINVVQNILILDGSTAETKRRLLSGLHSIYAVASLLSPLAVSLLYSSGVDWRVGLMLMAMTPLGAFVYSFFCELQPHVSGQQNSTTPSGFKKDIILFSIATGFYVIAEILLSSRFVLFMQREHNWSTSGAALLLSGFFVCMFAGRLLFTFKEFKSLTNRQIIRYSLCYSTVLFYLGVTNSPFFLVLTGLSMGPVFGVCIDYASEVFSYASTRAISSILALQSLVIVSMHFLIGAITQNFGIKSALLTGPLFLGLAYLLISIEPWSKRNAN